jgi:hypothetical protein
MCLGVGGEVIESVVLLIFRETNNNVVFRREAKMFSLAALMSFKNMFRWMCVNM